VREVGDACGSVRLKSWKVDESIPFDKLRAGLQPSNIQLVINLVNETLRVGTNALAEHVVCPALIDKYDGDED
jgi:hypothetical protein